MLKAASTITDIHNNCDATEVELVSLIAEKIPKYQLRADSAFGYDQQDWLQTPVLSPSTNVDLSPEQCEETFKYFTAKTKEGNQWQPLLQPCPCKLTCEKAKGSLVGVYHCDVLQNEDVRGIAEKNCDFVTNAQKLLSM